MKELIVGLKDDNKKLITYISSIFPHLKLNNIYKALRKKDIRINEVKVSKDVIIHANDKIKIYINDDILNGISTNITIPVVYEDDNIAIFNKPIGLEVEGKSSLTEIEEKNYGFIKPCHRIDINTCGLVLFAKNQESLSIFESKFKNEEIEKHYIALCYGITKASSATLEAYLFKASRTESEEKGCWKNRSRSASANRTSSGIGSRSTLWCSSTRSISDFSFDSRRVTGVAITRTLRWSVINVQSH